MKDKFKKIAKFLLQFGCDKYLVLGDSHATVFSHPLFKLYFPSIYFDKSIVIGATISGIENPNSKTDAFNLFNKKITNNYKKIIVLLGEVDLSFVLWYQAEKYNTNITEVFNGAVDKYKRFIEIKSKKAPIIIISAPLPTISDNNDWGQIANLRKEINTSQLDRTDLTLKFNKLIEEYCNKNNHDYINLDLKSINDNGLIRSDLLSKDKNNHHYNKYNYAKLIIKELKNCI